MKEASSGLPGFGQHDVGAVAGGGLCRADGVVALPANYGKLVVESLCGDHSSCKRLAMYGVVVSAFSSFVAVLCMQPGVGGL